MSTDTPVSRHVQAVVADVMPEQFELFQSPTKAERTVRLLRQLEHTLEARNAELLAELRKHDVVPPPDSQLWLTLDAEWTDQEIVCLQDGMLVDQLRLLADERTTVELREDLIAWIAAPRRSLNALKAVPFSFQACCAAAGVDFEEMRERTLAMFAPDLIDQLD